MFIYLLLIYLFTLYLLIYLLFIYSVFIYLLFIYLFIYLCLFNDTISIPDYIASGSRMNNESKGCGR
jgi:hypothetical protein